VPLNQRSPHVTKPALPVYPPLLQLTVVPGAGWVSGPALVAGPPLSLPLPHPLHHPLALPPPPAPELLLLEVLVELLLVPAAPLASAAHNLGGVASLQVGGVQGTVASLQVLQTLDWSNCRHKPPLCLTLPRYLVTSDTSHLDLS
jgi:hypothetical protein